MKENINKLFLWWAGNKIKQNKMAWTVEIESYCWAHSSQIYFTEILTATIVTIVLVIARTLENSSPKVPVWAVMPSSSRTSIDPAFIQTGKMLQMASYIWVPAGMHHWAYTWSTLKTENNLFKCKDIYEQKHCPSTKGEKWPKCLPRGIL